MSVFNWLRDNLNKKKIQQNFNRSLPTPSNFRNQIVQPIQRQTPRFNDLVGRANAKQITTNLPQISNAPSQIRQLARSIAPMLSPFSLLNKNVVQQQVQNYNQLQKPVAKYFEPTKDLRTRDVAREMYNIPAPKVKGVLKNVADLPRGIATAVASPFMTGEQINKFNPKAANEGYAKQTAGTFFDVGTTAAAPAVGLGKRGLAWVGESALKKLAAYGALRGVEGTMIGAGRGISQGQGIKETAEQLPGYFAAAAAFNTALSPRVLGKAASELLRTQNIANKLDAPVNRFISKIVNGQKINQYRDDLHDVVMPNSHFNYFRETGKLPEKPVVNDYKTTGNIKVTFNRKGGVESWTTDNPTFATNQRNKQLTMGMTTRNISPSELSTGAGNVGGEIKTLTKKPQSFANPESIGTTRKLLRVLTSGEAELKRMGKAGTELASTIKRQSREQDMVGGNWTVKLMDAMKGLNENERKLAGQVREGLIQSNDPKIVNAANKLKGLLDEIGIGAQKTGLKIKLPTGESVPFKLRENYMPRKYDFTELQKANKRQRYLQHLVDSGQAQNLSDAANIFDNFIKNNTTRSAGNLEHARTLDLPGYEQDPLKSVSAYIDSASRRLTEAKNYGVTDELAKSYIDRVRQEGGDEKYAQEVFDLMTGQKKYKNLGVDLATKFNYITKLDLGFITNATQPINTAVKTGIVNTLNGVLQAYFTPNRAGKFARKVGAVTDELISTGKGEEVSMGALMEIALKPFSYVERKNRTISAIAGKNYAQQMANRLLKNPNNKLAIRQLRSIGLDPEKIIAQGKILPEDILSGAKGVSDTTQFKVNAIDIPPGWKTNIGRLLSQFKSFSFKQTQFVRDEVLKEAAAGNIMPLVKLVALGVPASFVAQSVRNKLTGRNPKEEEKSLDVRKLDAYLKAFGTIPTDMIIQGKFLSDTYKNKYATPLKKIGRTVSSVLGPTVGEAFNITNALEQAGIQKEKNKDLPKGKLATDPYLELKRIGTGYLPFAGEFAKNTLLAYPKDNVSDFTRVIRAIENKDVDALQKAIETYKPEARKATIKRAMDLINEQQKENQQSYAPTNQLTTSASAAEGNNANFDELLNSLTTKKSEENEPISINTIKLNRLKDSDNLTEWNNLAIQQIKLYDNQLQKNDLTELERLRVEDKKNKLIEDIDKYKSYGGFKKPKKAKKAKTIKLSLKKPSYKTSTTMSKLTKPKISLIKTTGGSRGRQQGGGAIKRLRVKRQF